jgi:hypothetical protein
MRVEASITIINAVKRKSMVEGKDVMVDLKMTAATE